MKNKILSLIAAMVLSLSTFASTIKTDRTWYLAGEAMKVCVTSDALIAYAELCDTRGLAAGVVVRLKGGEGTGIMELPFNLHSGYYVLSVYTHHDARVSNQLVAIVNPLHKSVDDDIEWVLSDSCEVMGKGTADLVSQKDIPILADLYNRISSNHL